MVTLYHIDNRPAILYCLNFPSGKVYIGITREALAARVRRHIAYARSGKLYAVSCAIRKYGEDAFVAVEIGAGTWAEMKAAEIAAIAELGSKVPCGYNMTAGGEGSLGVKLSEATRRKISAALSVRAAAQPFTQEHRDRIAAAQRGKSIPEAVRAKMSSAAKADRASRGPMSEADREVRRQALTGRKRPPEVMARIWDTRKANAQK